MMQKEMIAKICLGLLIIMFSISCIKPENDKIILSLILKESEFSKNDSIQFDYSASNKTIIEFFKKRNSKNLVFNHVYEGSENSKVSDSSYYKIDSIIYKEKPVFSDSYLLNGKGVTKISETFLKDSFNYKSQIIDKWEVDDKTLEKFNLLYGEVKNKTQKISISKPVYNLKNNKAIVIKILSSKERSLFNTRTLYLVKKKNELWEIVFSQSFPD